MSRLEAELQELLRELREKVEAARKLMHTMRPSLETELGRAVVEFRSNSEPTPEEPTTGTTEET